MPLMERLLFFLAQDFRNAMKELHHKTWWFREGSLINIARHGQLLTDADIDVDVAVVNVVNNSGL